jgi:integrase
MWKAADMKNGRRPKNSGGISVRSDNGLTVYTLELPPDPVTGKRRRKSYASKDPRKAKEKFLAAKRELLANGTLESANTPALADWLRRWLDEFKRPSAKPRTMETYESDCRNIVKSIGAVRLSDLNASHVRRMERDITSTRSSKTALNAYRRLSNALDDAVREGIVAANVCRQCAPPRVEANPTRILEADQPARLIQAVGADAPETRRVRGQHAWPDDADDDRMWRLMWRVAFETGMRQAERFALTPADLIKFQDQPAIHVEHSLQRWRAGTEPPAWLKDKARNIEGNIWMTVPKSRKGIRIVPVSRTLWNDLAQWAKDHSLAADDLLFARQGHPLTNTVERRRWNRALDKAGLPHVTIRSARHYYATQLAEKGISEDARTSVMGHVSISTTAGYTHYDPKALAALTGESAIEIGLTSAAAGKPHG